MIRTKGQLDLDLEGVTIELGFFKGIRELLQALPELKPGTHRSTIDMIICLKICIDSQ